MKSGGIDSLESIPGLLKILKTSDLKTSHKVQYMYCRANFTVDAKNRGTLFVNLKKEKVRTQIKNNATLQIFCLLVLYYYTSFRM